MRKDPKETKNRILDTAESLFSDHGFGDVSLRRITQEAGVNIASVNYHFGSKDALISEVFTRVIAPINRERLALLGQSEANHGSTPVPLEEILEALHRPVVNQLKQSGLNESVYLKLAGRCLAESGTTFSDKLAKLFEEMLNRFMSATCKSLPHLNEADIFWRMHFSFGALVTALTDSERVAVFSRGRIQSPDPEETLRRLIDFTAAGLRAESRAESHQSKAAKIGAALTSLILATGLSGCNVTSPPNATPLATVRAPAHWVADKSSHSPKTADQYWITHFSDPSLRSFVSSVLENNKDLKAAQSRIEIATANARLVGAGRLPQLSGTFNSRRNKQNFIGFPIGGAGTNPVFSHFNQFGVGLNLSWEVDLWGRIKAAQQAAIAEFEASEFDRATAELSLTGQAVKAWLALAEAHDQIALTRLTIRKFSETEDLLRGRFERGLEENGRSFASELLLAKADVARARENLSIELERAERTARQLELLAGQYPAGQAGAAAKLPSFPGPVPTGLPASLLDRRPDLAVAERQIAAADKRLLEAKRALLPTINLTGSYGTASDDIADILSSSFSAWSIAANAAQPILQGGRLRANIARREAEVDLAVSNFEQAALIAFSEVENALSTEKHLKKRADFLGESSRMATQAYNRALEEFENGTGDILTVLSAQQQSFVTNSQLISLRRLLLDNRVELHLALGGSFQTQTKTKTTEDE
jgi:NodT family efflux transporter outer membrane factor (OMF) lipoprotein